jgi:hypothetical protein
VSWGGGGERTSSEGVGCEEEEGGAGAHFDDAVDPGCEEACVCALDGISQDLNS